MKRRPLSTTDTRTSTGRRRSHLTAVAQRMVLHLKYWGKRCWQSGNVERESTVNKKRRSRTQLNSTVSDPQRAGGKPQARLSFVGIIKLQRISLALIHSTMPVSQIRTPQLRRDSRSYTGIMRGTHGPYVVALRGARTAAVADPALSHNTKKTHTQSKKPNVPNK